MILLLLLPLCLAQDAQPLPGTEERVYQERYKMVIAPKSESCIFIEQLEVDWTLSLSYLVTSSKNGAQLDITLRLRDPDKRMVTYQGRRKQGNYSDYKVKTAGDYEVCWNNRHSMIDSKRLIWEYDIQGDEERELLKEENVVNATLTEYLEEAKLVRRSVIKVRGNVARSRHAQWWLGNKIPKDTERLEGVIAMIDTWSMAYSCLVCVVGAVQVVVLKRFFVTLPTSSKLKMST